MASYPATLWDKNIQDTSNDGPEDATIAQAGDYNEMANEVEAIINELGYGPTASDKPKGSKASLVARLAVALNDNGTLKKVAYALVAAHVFTTADSETIITDVGAAGAPSTRVGTLPAATGSLTVFHLVVTANGLQMVASGGGQIRIEGNISDINQYIKSTDPGASLILIDIATNLWIGLHRGGDWITYTA